MKLKFQGEVEGRVSVSGRLVLERWSVELGLETAETRLYLQDLQGADELFICNSLVGLRPVASLHDASWEQNPVCTALFQCYLRMVHFIQLCQI